MRMSLDEIFECINTGRRISAGSAGKEGIPVNIDDKVFTNQAERRTIEAGSEVLQMSDKSFFYLERRKKDLNNRLSEIEDEIAGRNESFREKVTEDGRLVNKKIDAFISEMLGSYKAYREYGFKEPLNRSQEDLYRTFLYCAIVGYSWRSSLDDFGGYYIPESYTDIRKMAELLQRYPMKKRKDLKEWISYQEDGYDIDPPATDDFWPFMEDILSDLDPEEIRKRKEREEKEKKEEEKRKKEAAKAWAEREAKIAAGEYKPLRITLQPCVEEEQDPEDAEAQRLQYEEDLNWYEQMPDTDPYSDPITDHYLEYALPQYNSWKAQLPKRNLICERYKKFKDLYFDDKNCDKNCIAKDITEMIDAYLYLQGISPFGLDDSFGLVMDKLDKAGDMMKLTVKRARVIG